MSRFALALVVLLVAFCVQAERRVVITPTKTAKLARYTGHAWRDDVTAAFEAMMKGNTAGARPKLDAAVAFCNALARPGLTLVSVATTAEYERYLDERTGDDPVEWVDHACPSAYKGAAFLIIEEKGNANDALAYLDKASAIAPYWAEPLAEKGFLLNQINRSPEALTAYLKAIELQNRFDNATNQSKALAWRGLGYTYVELGDLDKARSAYEESLKLEPGNALANEELEYIRKLHERRNPPAAASETSTQ